MCGQQYGAQIGGTQTVVDSGRMLVGMAENTASEERTLADVEQFHAQSQSQTQKQSKQTVHILYHQTHGPFVNLVTARDPDVSQVDVSV